MARLLFSKLSDVYELLEKTSSGNELRRILSSFFRQLPKGEIERTAYLTLGKIASDYEGINIGMAEKMVLRAIARASGKSIAEVEGLFRQKGDAGLVAEEVVGAGKGTLGVKEVFDSLHKIARASGAGSQDEKISILAGLLRQALPKEAKYICRIVLGQLRLGVADKTVLDALAIAFTGSKATKEYFEHAYNICPDIGIVAKTIAERGLAGIKKISVVVGRPVQMMLCQRVPTISMIAQKMPGLIAVEEKYDGERVQVHCTKGRIVFYSRRLEDITSQFPDVLEQIRKNIRAKEFVIEGEIVPVDEKGNLLPFQVLMQRRRKHFVEEYAKKIPVCLYLFELLYLNGRPYINKPYPERTAALKRIVRETKSLKFVNRIFTKKTEEIEDFFNKVVERGGEGIVAKNCGKESVYQAGTRGWLWIKWKPEYVKGLADTFDLVVVGAFYGRGVRAGTYGALLCAAYNDKLNRYETLCKLGSGFTEKQLAELPSKLRRCRIPKKHALVFTSSAMKPDEWFAPEVVVEVLGAELTRSPVHTVAVEKGKGVALRFPRFVRWRDDKKPEQATTTREIVQMMKRKGR